MKKINTLCMIFVLAITIVITFAANTELKVYADDMPANPIEKPGWVLTEHDEFNGNTLDESLWFPRYLGYRTPMDRGNTDYYFKDGSIVLRVTEDMPTYYVDGNPEPMKVSSLQTAQGDFNQGSSRKDHEEPYKSNFSQQYGYFEIRAKGPADRSGHTAFWMNTDDPSIYKPGSSTTTFTEIDIFENSRRNNYLFNLHNTNGPASSLLTGGTYDFDYSEDFHIYALEWTPEKIKYYVDNEFIAEHDATNIEKQPMFVYLSLYVNTWAGDSEPSYPAEFEIDYFRAYSKEGTLNLSIDNGESYMYLTPDQETYEYDLPKDTEDIPEVKIHNLPKNSSVNVIQADESTLTAIIELTLEDGSEYTYEVKFKGDLSDVINDAQSLLDMSTKGVELGQYPVVAYEELETALKNAKELLNDEQATESDEFATLKQLKREINKYKSARIMYDDNYIYHVYEDFNNQVTGSNPVGWDISDTDGTVEIIETPSSTDKSVKIHKNKTSTEKLGANKSFDPLEGKVLIETTVRSDTNEWGVLPYIYDSNGEMIVTIAFDGGQIRAYTDSWQDIQPYEHGEWYDLKIIIDTETDKFDLYIDGILKLEQAPLRNPAKDVSMISFHHTIGNTTMYFDNVKIYQEKEESEVDTSELETLIEKVEEYHADDYTEDSFATLTDALETSKALIANEETTQSEVDTAKEALQAAINGLEEKPVDVSAEKMRALVERFEEDGAFANELTARSLKTHLTAVDRYEKQEANEKVVKHMQSFKLLLDHQKEVKDISEEAYNALMDRTDSLIKKWE